MAIIGVEPRLRIASLTLSPRSKPSNKSAEKNKKLTRKKMRPIHRFCYCHGQLAHNDYTDVKHTEDDGSDVQGKFASAALKELSQGN